jgi:hypothetical protein
MARRATIQLKVYRQIVEAFPWMTPTSIARSRDRGW